MVDISSVRSELQLPSAIISDDDINYVIMKVGADINLVCAEVLRLFVRKNRGRRRFRIGKYEEEINYKVINSQIAYYMSKSSASSFDDGAEIPDSRFDDTDGSML